MSDTAAPVSPAAAPAAPAPNTNGSSLADDSTFIPSSGSFHEYQKQLADRAKALKAKDQAKPAQPRAATAPQPVKPAEPAAPAEPIQALSQPGEPAPPADSQEAVPQEAQPEPAPDSPEALAAAQAAQQADQELLSKVKDWLAMGGDVPDFMADVPIRLPNGKFEPMSEVIKGFMRQDDHTNAWKQREAEKQEWTAKLNAYETHFKAVDDPDPMKAGDALYEIYTRNGRRKAAMKFAEKLAQDEEKDILSARGTMMAYAQKYGIQDQNDYRLREAFNSALAERQRFREMEDTNRAQQWEIERSKKQIQDRTQQDQQLEYGKRVQNQIAQLMPRAFKAIGMSVDAQVEQIFRDKLHARAVQTNAAEITPELVLDAARMTRDHMETYSQRLSGAAPGGSAVQRNPPQPRLGAGSGKIAGSDPKNNTQDLTTEDFAKKFGIRYW